MGKFARFEDHPENLREKLKQRMHKRITARQLRQHKVSLRPGNFTPDGEWFLFHGDFAAVGNGQFQTSFLGPDELGELWGYDLRCVWNNPEDYAHCWRSKKKISKIRHD